MAFGSSEGPALKAAVLCNGLRRIPALPVPSGCANDVCKTSYHFKLLLINLDWGAGERPLTVSICWDRAVCCSRGQHTFPALSERCLSGGNVQTSRMAGKAQPWRWKGGNCKSLIWA